MLDIDLTFSQESIDNAVKQIEAYRDSIEKKNAEFISKLADLGISVGYTSLTHFRSHITFRKKMNVQKTGRATGRMIGRSNQVLVQWQYPNASGYEEAYISPILMAEFGSGPKASDASGKPNANVAKKLGYGRGTFPRQQHANQPSWSYMDMDGEWQTSSGVEPSMPMWKAAREMRMEIARVARQVFNS